jgi:hypothetical protein
MQVGVTGHIGLTPESYAPIYAELVRVLRELPDVHGISCLAPGADEIFVSAVKDAGRTYEVVLPYRGYRAPRSELLGGASAVTYAAPRAAGTAAYVAASDELLRRCDHLVAVWDRDPAGVPGGTAYTVAEANRLELGITVVWPAGAARIPSPPASVPDRMLWDRPHVAQSWGAAGDRSDTTV